MKATLALAVVVCLGSMTVQAAERGNSSAPRLKKSVHRASNIEDDEASGVGKISASRSKHSPSARRHISDRASNETRKNHDRKRTPSDRDAAHVVNEVIQPDANVPVELPQRANGNDSDTEIDDDHPSSTLFGGATDNGPPR